MRRLILMRHAKSSWAEADQPDHDRPLDARGRADAPRMGAWLAAQGFVPQLALVSTAARTQETWARLGRAFAGVPMRPTAAIYEATTAGLLSVLRKAPEAKCLLMLGHMPATGALARAMLATPPLIEAFDAYPTLATTVIDLEVADWAGVTLGTGDLAGFAAPRMLAN